MKRFGIRAKFALLIVALLLALFSAVTIILVQRNTSTLRQNLLNEAQSFAALATNPIGDVFVRHKDSGLLQIEQQIARLIELNPRITNVTIVGLDGRPLFSQKSEAAVAISAEQAAAFGSTMIYGPSGELRSFVQPYLESFGGHRYSMVYSISNASIDQAINDTIRSLVALSLAALVVGIIITYLAVDYLFLRPLKDVSQRSLNVAGGKFEQTIKLERNDEISDLAQSVNTMADALKADIAKLQETDKLKTEFTIISSHNIRTPLTVITNYLHILGSLKLNKKAQDLLKIISASSQRLMAFAEDMLVISQIEGGKEEFHKEPVNLLEILQPITGDFAAISQQKKIKFTADLPKKAVMINGSASHLRTALWNLLDNAYKFTNEGGQVSLSVEVSNNQAVIKVADTGIGISKSELPKLFTKFHRGTDLMRYNYEGEGLGLYLTKIIIDRHGGKIDVVSQEGEGSTFTVYLPLS